MDDEGTGEGLSADRRVEIRVRKNGRKDKVIVEKSDAEGLPEGWIKELVITKRKGQRNRRDPYFIDPKSGYVFQSFKDASRYVRTGVLGKHARKPKENSQDEDDSPSAKSFSPAGSMEKKSAENGSEKEKKFNIYVRNSKRKSLSSSDEKSENSKVSLKLSTTGSQVPEVQPGKKEEVKDPMERKQISCSESNITTASDEHTVEKRVTRSQAKGEENYNNCKLKRKSLSLLDENSEIRMVSPKPNSVSSRVLEEEPGKKEGAKDSTERKHISCSGNDIAATQDEKPVEKRFTRSQAKEMKTEDGRELKRKSELCNTLPRRASKRLAGIEVEQTPEPKTRNSARQEPAVEQSDEAVARKHEEASFGLNPLPLDCRRRLELSINQVVAEKYEEHSSSKPSLALNNGEKKQMPLGSEKIDEAVDKKSEGHSGKKPNDAKKKEMQVVSHITHQTAAKKSDEAADAKPVTSLGSYKQMKKSQPVMLTFQSVAAMTNETAGRKSGGPLQPKPNTFISSRRYVDNNVVQMRNGVEKDIAPILSTGNFAVNGSGSFLTEEKANKVSEPPALDSTLEDLWKDPCIAFAIKTLTGESLDPPATEPRKVTGAVNIHGEQRGIGVLPEMPNDSSKGNKNSGSSSALPEADLWKDPCIEFAIKTLTGAIPVGFDQTEEDQSKYQQQMSPVVTQVPASKQSDCDYLRQQFNLTHKTVAPGGACLPQQILGHQKP